MSLQRSFNVLCCMGYRHLKHQHSCFFPSRYFFVNIFFILWKESLRDFFFHRFSKSSQLFFHVDYLRPVP